jgi:hypothetical protein
MTRHKVFISYHHQNDQYYKDKFASLFDDYYDIFIDGSVSDGDIDDSLQTESIRQKIRDEYLRDTSITLVLIGTETWKRKHIDWEISSSIRDTKYNPRSGLLGILLPTHPNYNADKYLYHLIPPRLADNCQNNYACVYNWRENPSLIKSWLETAYNNKDKIIPNNSRPMFANNRSGDSWTD